MTLADVARIPADASLADELSREDMVEMANLASAQTGVSGTIFISSAMGAHGPRVKYFVQPGRTQPSFSVSIADPPVVVANSLPARTVRQLSPQVIEWVTRNRDALLDFWHRGDTWTQPEVNDFIQRLQRVSDGTDTHDAAQRWSRPRPGPIRPHALCCKMDPGLRRDLGLFWIENLT